MMDLLPITSKLMSQLLGTSSQQASIIIRPAELDDVQPILDMHQRLSSDTIYNRYHANRLPTQAEIERVVQLDNENGRAFVAVIPGYLPKIIGLAFYIVTDQGTAETAFLVEDLYQGQGLGRRLMQALSKAAKKEDICIFNARVLRSNRPMMHLLYTSGQLIDKKPDYDALELQVDICPVSV